MVGQPWCSKRWWVMSKQSVWDLSKLCDDGRVDEALQAVDLLNKKGVPVSRDTIYRLLQGCFRKKDLASCRKVRTLMLKHGFDSIAPLGDILIRLFASCGSLREAEQVFSKISYPTVFTWNSIISAHIKLGEGVRALQLYAKLQREGIKPDKVTFLCISKACGSIGAIFEGRVAHYHIIGRGLESEINVANTLIDMYAKCGTLVEARKVFDELLNRDVVSWAVMISGYALNGDGVSALELYTDMQLKGVKPNDVVILCALKACGCLLAIKQGRLIHSEIFGSGFKADEVLMSTLVDMYAKCGSLEEAQIVFEQLPKRDVVSYGAMIAGFAQYGYALDALQLFEKMQQDGTGPNEVTFLGILKACGSLSAINEARLIHSWISNIGLETGVVIGTTIVDTYAKCGSLHEAQKAFAGLMNRNVVSWGALIAGFAQDGHAASAFACFNQMQLEGIEPNRAIYLCILKACGSIGAVEDGRLIHDQLLQIDIGSDLTIANTLVHMYAKCESTKEALKIFDDLPNRDEVSWGAMISGYSRQGYSVLALHYFERLWQSGLNPNRAIYLCVLKACGTVVATRHGKLIHEEIIIHGLETDFEIGNKLVEMYAKIGSLEDAHRMFGKFVNQDVISCGAMISGYVRRGEWRLATQFLEGMCQAGLKPDGMIFVDILTACSLSGLLEEGQEFFKYMRYNHKIMPNMEHYSCVIDLLGRAGQLNVAEDLLQTLPRPPDAIMWTSLLTSCRTYSDVGLGKQCFSQVVSLDRIDSSGYILMSNIFADAHMWEDIENIQDLRLKAAAWKAPASACVEVNKNGHEFLVGAHSIAGCDHLPATLVTVSRSMKRQGFVPQLDLVLHQVPG